MRYLKIIGVTIFILILGGFLIIPAVFADTTQTLQTQQAQQAELQKQLDEIQQQISDLEKQLTTTTAQKKTLANKIAQLKTKQSALRLQIKKTALVIADLEKKLVATEKSIQEKTIKEVDLKKQLTKILQTVNVADQNFFLELLNKNSIGDFFEEVNNYGLILDSLDKVLEQTRQVKKDLQIAKIDYADQQDEAKQQLQIKTIQQTSLLQSLNEQSELLQTTKGQEKNYQDAIADSKARAAEIKSRIYELFNTGKQINFEEAVNIATWASKLTGVRAAFLLAILTQESNLGKNVGTCNRINDPPEKSWKVVMKPDRDQEPFKKITTELGLDVDTTPVSCPMRDKNGKQSGWGGAMGPAQFIPSTWMGWKDKVSSITGKSPANPWDIRDAFLASALKLKGNGAGKVSGEWNAAMYYFSGGLNLKYRFYADNVATIAKGYQEDIDAMQK